MLTLLKQDVDFNDAVEFLSTGEDSAETLQRALSGDVDALRQVQNAMVAVNMQKLDPDVDIDISGAVAAIDNLQSWIQGADLDAEGYATLDNSNFIQKLDKIMKKQLKTNICSNVTFSMRPP